ncbi:MAG TPA: hypothetical protein VIE13_07315 [Terriglobales bacterium]|jgi:hypothetical protein
MSTAHTTHTRVLSGSFPAPTGQAAIVLGFLLGTWMLVDGLTFCITGAYLPLAATLPRGPVPAMAWLTTAFGALWMFVPNLFLFQNRVTSWKAMLVLIVASSWYLGVATPILLTQLVLLLLPATRRGLR